MTSDIDSPEFRERFLADLAAVDRRGPILLELDAGSALTLVGQLQLALRHPLNRGSSAVAARKAIDCLVSALGATETLLAGLLAGDDPRHDTPTAAARGEAVVRPTVVCLCGSTRFWRDFQAAVLSETLCGRIVLSIGAMTASDGDHGITPEQKAMLDELHLRKIDMADEILVLNRHGYMGESTRRELEYARSLGKRVRFLEPSEGGA